MVFLDVDGTLIPLGPVPESRPRPHDLADRATSIESNPLLDRLNPDDGARLLDLEVDLLWATSWMADANDEVSPRLGLPELPIVEWSAAADNPPDGLHWKTQDLVTWAAGHPFIWIDDEIYPADRDWVAQHHQAPSLLHRVDARQGLTEGDFAHLRQWLAANTSTPPPDTTNVERSGFPRC